MPCSDFVWLLCFTEGSGQTLFYDETCLTWRDMWAFSSLSLQRQREVNILSPFSAVPLSPGILCKMRALHREILVRHKQHALHCLLCGYDHMPFVYFCYESFWNDTKVCSSPCSKKVFFQVMLTSFRLLLEEVWFMVNLHLHMLIANTN